MLDHEARHVLLDFAGQVFLRQVGAVEPHVVGPAGHRLGVGDGVQKAVGHVADVHEVAAVVPFEEHQVAIRHGRIGKMVDQQVQSHPRRHAENRGQPKRDGVGTGQQLGLRLHFGAAVVRDRL